MPSSILSANPRLLSPTLYTKLDGLDRYRRNTKNPLQISKKCLRFSISSRNPAVNCRRLPSLSIRCHSTESGKSIDVESVVDRRLGDEVASEGEDGSGSRLNVEVGTSNLPVLLHASKMSLGDQAFFLLAFIACTTSIAFTSLVIAAVPTLIAMGRAATSLSKLADTAREELPSTMAAIRLSGMEISDLTLELSDLSQEIADGVSKSAQAVQAAEAGIRQIGAIARRQTISMIQERASLPIISLQPVVAGAARKTSNAVDHARKTFMNMISQGILDQTRYCAGRVGPDLCLCQAFGLDLITYYPLPVIVMIGPVFHLLTTHLEPLEVQRLTSQSLEIYIHLKFKWVKSWPLDVLLDLSSAV